MPAEIWIDYPLTNDSVPQTFTARGGFLSGSIVAAPVIVITATLSKPGAAAIPPVVATTFCPSPPAPGGGVGTDTQWQATFANIPQGAGYSLSVTIKVDAGPVTPAADASNSITVNAQAVALVAQCATILAGNEDGPLPVPGPGPMIAGVQAKIFPAAAPVAAAACCTPAPVGLLKLDEAFPIELYPKVASVAGILYEKNSPIVLENFTGYFNIGRAILLGTYPSCKFYRARLWLLDADGNVLWLAPERALQKLPC